MKIKEEAELVSEALFSLTFYFKTFFEVINVKILVLFLFLVLNVNGNINSNLYENRNSDLYTADIQKLNKDIFVNGIRNKAQNQLIIEVDNYIDSMASNNKLSAKNLVNVCQKYDLDIVFVLSQALLESHFGTKGIAATTNSIFNVGTYDDGQILYRYKHPDESIEPYAKLLVNKYLVDKEILNLLEDKGYTNINGLRFASAKKYESNLRKIMIRIDLETDINMLQKVVSMDDNTLMAYFGPDKELDYSDQLYAMN